MLCHSAHICLAKCIHILTEQSDEQHIQIRIILSKVCNMGILIQKGDIISDNNIGTQWDEQCWHLF